MSDFIRSKQILSIIIQIILNLKKFKLSVEVVMERYMELIENDISKRTY